MEIDEEKTQIVVDTNILMSGLLRDHSIMTQLVQLYLEETYIWLEHQQDSINYLIRCWQRFA